MYITFVQSVQCYAEWWFDSLQRLTIFLLFVTIEAVIKELNDIGLCHELQCGYTVINQKNSKYIRVLSIMLLILLVIPVIAFLL